ncbi:hypothetical protein LCGC14_1298490 [marine sediment metagenome]|uniref:Uncharacterized protein n=1 Tax=marine sediment metagenome TaxID=412755 RepID=A0A0F9LAX2_9ZZZZ
MSKEEDFSEFTGVHKNNREKLGSYKEKLKKELDDLKILAGEKSIKNTLRKESEIKLSDLKPPPSIKNLKYEILEEEISDIKTENESLKNRIYSLENENNSLRRDLDNLKSENYKLKTEQPNISILENEISSLREMITIIAQEKQLLEERVVEEPSTVEPRIHKEIEEKISEKVLPKEKVQEVIKKPSKKKKKKKLSADEIKAIKAEHEEAIAPKRRRCPTCLNLNKKYIREMDDKTNIILQSPRIYGKKFKCGICGTEWK